MNCDWTKENIVLYVYEELADDAKFELESHVQRCLPCRHELESALELKKSLALFPVQEISPNFLAASRMKLQESLEHAEQSAGWRHFIFDFAGWLHQIKLAPALTVALLMIGFTGGALTAYKIRPGEQIGPTPAPETNASVASVQSVVADPNSHQISIKYDTLSPQMAQGAANDPKIQQLLLLAARSAQDGVRHDAYDVLTTRPENEDNAVREALIYAVRYDKNPGVRLRALEGLKGYVRDDVHVRDAVLEALMHDTNAGVRQTAIGLLDPVKADMSVREALRALADHDDNKFIKAESKRVLASMPNFE
ncbi:MAG TPA: HEAT repeat domain-containing protein [Verrucomicrobiae bacterium]|jgi:hypothetical protein|nr:HEAT repeat domain-containing protein [Verrucomicrobiae bacterium]